MSESMRETWYELEDGSLLNPADAIHDRITGWPRHKDGRPVAKRGDVPSSRGVDPEEERAKVEAGAVAQAQKKAAAEAAAKAAAKAAALVAAAPAVAQSKDMKADEPKQAYTTRDVKAG